MGLDLNEKHEHIRIDDLEIPFFREFHGSNVKKASEVKKAGRVLAPVYSIMERKASSSKPDWNENYFDSGDGFAYPVKGAYKDRRFKIELNSQDLRDMKKGSELINHGLVIPSYEGVKGREFIDVVTGRDLKESEVPEHPVWLEVFRGNRELLGQVAHKIFKAGKDTHNYDTMMGIYLADELADPHLRAAIPGSLEYGSRLRGWYDLVDGVGRFVGVAPEALSVPNNLVKPNLETALFIINEHLVNSGLRIAK